MSERQQERILVVDTNLLFLEKLAQRLRALGYQVITANTGEQAFHLLRDWQHPIAWLYVRAALPSLIDGWILADEYHDTHPRRAVVIAASTTRLSPQGDIILDEPTPATVLQALLLAKGGSSSAQAVTIADINEQRCAA